jgi:hypothetical protein
MYMLMPNFIEEKSSITIKFLKAKMKEYELLQSEINILMREAMYEVASPVSIEIHTS